MRAEGAWQRQPRLPSRSLEQFQEPGAAVEIAGLRHRFGELEVLGGLDLEVARGRGRRPRRPVGLRQVDAARADRRPARAERAGTLAGRRRAGRPPSGSPAASTCRSATCCCRGSRRSTTPRSRRATAARRARERARAGRAPVRALRARRVRAVAAGASSRAACASGSPSCARCWPTSRCCCSTSRSPRSTRSRAPRCRSGSPGRSPPSRCTVVLVTHDVEEALYLCDRVAVLTRAAGARVGRARLAGARARRRGSRRSPRPSSPPSRERALEALAEGSR